MTAPLELTGQRFGRLTVIGPASRPSTNRSPLRFWLCRCDCGNESIVAGGALRFGNSKSCGCLSRDTTTARNFKHGCSPRGRSTAEYEIWKTMHARCERPTNSEFRNYGARGIAVCDRWKHFEFFIADVGSRPSPKHSIERRNNDLGYSPDNCYWATWQEQMNNTRVNRRITYNGETRTVAQWAEMRGMHYLTLWNRLVRAKWSVERALMTPVRVQ